MSYSQLARSLFNRAATSEPAASKAKPRKVRASYDAAQTADLDENHWAWVDALNANASNSPDVRKTLRERAQYEADNNGYCGGLVDRLGNDLIGTCPRLQLVIPGADRDAARQIERAFATWARKIGLGQKLRMMDNAAYIRGESFALLTTNPRLDSRGVQLDLKLYETDQVETPWYNTLDTKAFSGGRLDEFGNVAEWHFLKAHPGSDIWYGGMYEFDPIPANRVIHWFKPRRAGQIRGVPEILSSLTLYAYLRRYTLATVCAAETAASIAGILHLPQAGMDPNEDPGANGLEVMDKVPVPRGALLTAPGGSTLGQLKAEHPITNYEMFKDSLLTEMGSTVSAPRNISTNSSAAYNYSSGRLDVGLYHRGVKVRRGDLSDTVLDRIADAFLDEAALVPNLIPDGLPIRAEWVKTWRFDGFSAIDPQKESIARDTDIRNGTTTYAEVFAEKGLDWEEAIEQQGRELELRNQFGLTAATAMGTAGPPTPGVENEDGEEVSPGKAGAAAAGGGVQSTALNGAQVTSLLLITDAVVAKRYPAGAAEGIIRAAFPLMPSSLVKSFVSQLAAHEPPVVEVATEVMQDADAEAAAAV